MLVGASAARHPARPAITDLASGRSLDYATLAAAIEDVARQLRARGRGARPADRARGRRTRSATCPAAFGILAAGGCLVPLAPTLRPAEVSAVLDETDVNARVTLRDDAAGTRVDRPEARAAAGLRRDRRRVRPFHVGHDRGFGRASS